MQPTVKFFEIEYNSAAFTRLVHVNQVPRPRGRGIPCDLINRKTKLANNQETSRLLGIFLGIGITNKKIGNMDPITSKLSWINFEYLWFWFYPKIVLSVLFGPISFPVNGHHA